jgi:hypothetical protein
MAEAGVGGHRFRWVDVVAGALVGALVLGPASLLLGATFDRPTALGVLGFASAPLLGVLLVCLRRSRVLGVGVLIGIAVFWIVLLPVCAAVLGG